MADRVITVPQATQIAQATKRQLTELNGRLDAIDAKPVRNLVTEVISDKRVEVTTSHLIRITDASGYRYARIPVTPGKTYALSVGASSNFSRWAMPSEATERWISNVTFASGNLVTAPENATILYICANGLPAELVVLEQDTSITGASIIDYPYNTTVRVEIPKLYSVENNGFVDDLLNEAKESAVVAEENANKISVLENDSLFHTMSGEIGLAGTTYTAPIIVLNPSETGFDDGMIESPMVWWDSKHLKWGMVYTGYKSTETQNVYAYGSIGLAWSDDLVTWEKDTNAPILTHSDSADAPDYGSVTGPVMYLKDGVYYLYYIGCSVAGYEQGNKSLCLATGTDIYNLTKSDANPLIYPSNVGTTPEKYYSRQIYHANIIEYNGVYYMLINCNGVHPEQNRYCENILCFTSPDLINWTYHSIALACSTSETAPDYQVTGDPCVYDIGDDYLYMTFFRASQNYASSSGSIARCLKKNFPNGWERTNIVPVTGYHKFFVAQRAGKMYIYGSTRRIAVAEALT